MKAKNIFFYFLIALLISASTTNAQWVQTNGPYGASVYSFATSGTDLFVGTIIGVFRSTDNGTSWSAASSGLPDFSQVRALATSGTNIFAATSSYGVYRSTNNGTNWVLANSGLSNNYVNTFAVIGSNIFAGTSVGVYLSTDNGSNWNPANSGLIASINTLVVSGTNIFAGGFFGVYLSTNNGGSWTAANNGLNRSVSNLAVIGDNIFASTSNGVYLSTDNGANWNIANSGLPNGTVRALAVSGTDLFAGIPTYPGGWGVYRSTNNGNSWTSVNTGLTNKEIYAFAVIGTNIFAGAYSGGGVYLSTDNGNNWNAVNTGLTNTTVSALAISGNNIFAGTSNNPWYDIGIYLSTDNGTSWNPANSGLTNTVVNAFAVSGTNIFAGTDNGAFVSTNNGTSWNTVNSNWSNKSVTAFAISGSNIFAGVYLGGVYLSTDNGVNWTSVNSGLTNVRVRSLTISGTSVFVGTDNGVFLSTDNGANWNAANSGLPNALVRALAVSGTNIFAGITGGGILGGVYLSTDNGTTWSAVNTGLTSTEVYTFAVSGTNLIAGTVGGIFLSTNNGANWTSESTGLIINSNANVNALIISGTNLFAGLGQYGVWRRPLAEIIPPLQLQLAVTPTTIQTLDWGQSTTYISIVTDQNNSPVSGVSVGGSNDLEGNAFTVTTGTNGQASYVTTVPNNKANGSYTINFVATKTGYISSQLLQRQVQVNHTQVLQLQLAVTPTTIQTLDWGQSITYTSIVTDQNNSPVSGVSVGGANDLEGNAFTVTTGTNGQANYVTTVPNNKANGSYTINFVATKTGYNSSQLLQRQVQVNHTALFSISGKIKDVYVNFTNGNIDRRNISAKLKLFNGEVEIANTISDNNGNFNFPSITSGVYNIEVSNNDLITTRDYTLKVLYKNIQAGSSGNNYDYPDSLFHILYVMKGYLEQLKYSTNILLGSIPFIIDINGYNLNSEENLLNDWSYIDNDIDRKVESLSRLLIEENAHIDYFTEASSLTIGTIKTIVDLGFNLATISKISGITALSDNNFIIKKIIKYTAKLFIKTLRTIANWTISTFEPSLSPQIRSYINQIFNLILFKIEDTKPALLQESVKTISYTYGTKFFLEDFYIPLFTQKSLDLAVQNTTGLNYVGTFEQAYLKNISIDPNDGIISKIEGSRILTNDAKSNGEFYRDVSNLTSTASDLTSLLTAISASLGAEPFAAIIISLPIILKTISVASAGKSLSITIKRLVVMPSELNRLTQSIYNPILYKNHSFYKNLELNNYQNNEYLNKLSTSTTDFNQTLTNIINYIIDNKREEAYNLIPNLLELDSLLNLNTDYTLYPIFSTVSLIDSSNTTFYNKYDTSSIDVENSYMNRQSIYYMLISSLSDSTKSSYIDSLKKQLPETIDANNTMLNSLYNLDSQTNNLPSLPFIAPIKTEVPSIVNTNSSFDIKIIYKNFGGTDTRGLYLKILLDAGFNTQNDSIKINELAANNKDSTTITVFSPPNDTSGSYSIIFYSDSSSSIPINGIIKSYLTVGIKNSNISPSRYLLFQNYPNPFNPTTKIKYYLPSISNVKIIIYNILGQKIKVLVDNIESQGFKEVNFNASNYSSGVYFYRIIAISIDGQKEFNDVKKLILMK